MSDQENRFDPEAYDTSQDFVADYGREVIDVLDPRPGERVLDLGCGTGHLTAEIAEAVAPGGCALGIDASPEMVDRAREAYPDRDFACADATEFDADRSFDAVFSNAAIHWIDDQDALLDAVGDVLVPGGRFVAEMGADGNVVPILEGVRAEAAARGVTVVSPWYFPTLGEYTTRLEAHGFAVRLARTFVRETELEGERGLQDWLDQFGDTLLGPFEEDSDVISAAVADRMRAEWYDADAGSWFVPYRRLQFDARYRGEDSE